MGIEAVLDMCEIMDNITLLEANNFVYKKIAIEDTSETDILCHFDDATSYIRRCVMADRPILVHCVVGVSRSPTIVVAYLMRYHGMGADEGIDYVQSKRSIISPNIGFIMQLYTYEKYLMSRCCPSTSP